MVLAANVPLRERPHGSPSNLSTSHPQIFLDPHLIAGTQCTFEERRS